MTPEQVVAFLISGGYIPYRRVSKDQILVVWVRKEYRQVESMFARENYQMPDAVVKGGVRVLGPIDRSGVVYDRAATTKKLADFYDAPVDDFQLVPMTPLLLRDAKNFVMLVEHGMVCDKAGRCYEETFMRGLGGMVRT
jgi:hypothetical protein